MPIAYLTGEAWFAGLNFKSDTRALVPRSPIAELIESGFEPWLGGREVLRALDLCTGSGCIAIAMAHYNPDWHVDGVDISDDALALAAENKTRLHADNARLFKSDLFSGLSGEHYDLIVTNPPYVTNAETDALPKEYSYEPELGLRAGDDGLDLVLKILRDAPLHLSQDGLLICEVGESERALVELLPEVRIRLDRVQSRADGHLRGRVRRAGRASRRASANWRTRAAEAATAVVAAATISDC